MDIYSYKDINSPNTQYAVIIYAYILVWGCSTVQFPHLLCPVIQTETIVLFCCHPVVTSGAAGSRCIST